MHNQSNLPIQKRMRPLLGTFVEVGLVDAALDSSQIDQVFQCAFERIEKIQSLLSFHSPISELTRLNSSRNEWIHLSKDSYDCLLLAKYITQLTEYKFNPFLGSALIHHQALSHAQLPNYQPEYDASGCMKNLKNLELKKNRARLNTSALICLDGIAKGYAVDKATIEIQKAGVSSGWINAGGDIRVFGHYVMPIHQKNHRGELVYLGGLQNASIATSTSISSNEYPGLMLSPTGEKLQPSTWTVIAPIAWRADALTKVAANSSDEERQQLMEKFRARWVSI